MKIIKCSIIILVLLFWQFGQSYAQEVKFQKKSEGRELQELLLELPKLIECDQKLLEIKQRYKGPLTALFWLKSVEKPKTPEGKLVNKMEALGINPDTCELLQVYQEYDQNKKTNYSKSKYRY